MSELKAFDVGLGQYTEDGSPCVVAFDADQNPRLLNEKVYLKSEADKVIADLEDKLQNISGILKETREWLIESQRLHKRCADNAVKEIHHQKYKRCLAMADRCRERFHHYVALVVFSPNKGATPFYNRRRDRAYKWMYKWRELAEKFKEEG